MSGPKLIDFNKVLEEKFKSKVDALKEEVEKYSQTFPLPGLEKL